MNKTKNKYIIENLSGAMVLNIIVCLENLGSVISYDEKMFIHYDNKFSILVSNNDKDNLNQYFDISKISLFYDEKGKLLSFEELLKYIIEDLYLDSVDSVSKALYENFHKRFQYKKDLSGYIQISSDNKNLKKKLFKDIVGIITDSTDFEKLKFYGYDNSIIIFYVNPVDTKFINEIRKNFLNEKEINLYYSPFTKFGELEKNIFLQYDLLEHPFLNKLREIHYFENHLLLISKKNNNIDIEIFNESVIENFLLLGSFGGYVFKGEKENTNIKNVTISNKTPLDYIEVDISLKKKSEYIKRLKSIIDDEYESGIRIKEINDYYTEKNPDEIFLIAECEYNINIVKKNLSSAFKSIFNMLDDKILLNKDILNNMRIAVLQFEKPFIVIYANKIILNNIDADLIADCLKIKFNNVKKIYCLKNNKGSGKIFVEHGLILRPDIKYFNSEYIDFINRLGKRTGNDVLLFYKLENDKAFTINMRMFNKLSNTFLSFFKLYLKDLKKSADNIYNHIIERTKEKKKIKLAPITSGIDEIFKNIIEQNENDVMVTEINNIFKKRNEIWDQIFERCSKMDEEKKITEKIIGEFDDFKGKMNSINNAMLEFGNNLDDDCMKIVKMESMFNIIKSNQALEVMQQVPLGIQILPDSLLDFFNNKRAPFPSKIDVASYIYNKLKEIMVRIDSKENRRKKRKTIINLKKKIIYFRDLSNEVIDKIDKSLQGY